MKAGEARVSVTANSNKKVFRLQKFKKNFFCCGALISMIFLKSALLPFDGHWQGLVAFPKV